MAQIVGFIEESAYINAQRPDVSHRGINAGSLKLESAIAILYVRSFHMSNARDVSGERNNVTHHLNVLVGETDSHARLVAARLLRSPARINTDRGCAERLPDILNGAHKSLAISKKQHNCCDAPSHTQHGEQGFTEIVAHGAVRFGEGVPSHFVFSPSFPAQCFNWFEQRR